MRKFILLLLSAALVMGANAFADSPARQTADVKVKKVKKCLFPKSRKRAPDWVCKAQDDSETVTAVGSFHKSGAGIEFMEQMASTDARVNLAKKLRGTGSQTITDEQLQGSRVIKKIYGPKGTLYVLIGFDKAAAQKLQ